MSSRSGSNNRRQRSRESHDEYQSPIPPRLPSLRALAAQRERDNSSPASSSRPQSRHWTTAASRRAERIRSLEAEASQSTLDQFQRVLDHAYAGSGAGHADRTRGSDSRSSNLDDIDRSLDEANSHLRTLLEMTSHTHTNLANTLSVPQILNSGPFRRPPDPDENRRSKRRKLDSDKLPQKLAPFRYGKYGQVEPGQLRMEIVSCDGGMFSNESSYAAENILKNDHTVYCTKGNRCNIVLRHQDATAFTLQELIIKGPTSMNYSHPIREGMVFVSMHEDEVLNRTAQYQIQYGPRKQRESEPEWPRIEEEDQENPLPGPRRSYPVRPTAGISARVRRQILGQSEEDDYRIAQMPPEFANNLHSDAVSTECSGEYEEERNRYSYRRHPPDRIGSLPFENMDSDEDDDFNGGGGAGGGSGGGSGGGPGRDGSNSIDFEDFSISFGNRYGNERPNGLSLSEAWEAHANATQEALRAVGGELLSPHARFFIEKKKSTCTIRFDPPVSGRFILLKMWNSHHDPNCNIDVQSVTARGFAGPRYFPSIELR